MKIRIIEYKCIVNELNQPYGHAEKAVEDAIRICEKMGIEYEIATSNIFLGMKKEHRIELPNIIEATAYDYRNKKKIFQNLSIAIKSKPNDNVILWFVNVDWFLFFFIATHKVRNKIIATVYKNCSDYINGFKGKKMFVGNVLTAILKRGVRKVDLYLETFTNENRSSNAMFVPDYLYTSFYDTYKNTLKKKRVICPGTINSQKDVEGLITVFSKTNYELLIIGGFTDITRFNKINKTKSSNISIMNKRLDYDEYCKLIAESTYCITPYKVEFYNSATSGVVREAIYLGTTVIAPNVILHNTGLNGIGYDNIDEVFSILNNGHMAIANNLEPYKEDNVINSLRSAIIDLKE